MRAQDEQPVLDWRIDVGLITEPLLLAGYLKMMAIVALIFGGLLSFMALVSGNFKIIPSLLEVAGMGIGVMLALSLFVAVVVMRNRYGMRFIVDDRGVRQLTTDRRARAGADAALAAGALTQNPGAIGAGLIAQSEADRGAGWDAIESVRYHPARRAIALANSWRTVMLIFCTPENYEAVAARVAAETGARLARRKPRPSPLPGLLLRTAIVIFACLPFFILPRPFELDLLAPFLTLGFGLAAVWLIPQLGVAALVGLGWMWLVIAMRMDDLFILSRPDRLAALMVAGAATAALVVLISGLMRGVYASGLAGDEAASAKDER